MKYMLIRKYIGADRGADLFVVDRNLNQIELAVLIKEGVYDAYQVRTEMGFDGYRQGKRLTLKDIDGKIGFVQ